MPRRLRVVQFGLGPIGTGIARLLSQRPEFELVGAIDNDPRKVGEDLRDVIGPERVAGVRVDADAGALERIRPDVVTHATSSFLTIAEGQLAAAARAGARVVSTCEELVYPFQSHPEIAARLDSIARSNGSTILGTGVNPGFVMDTLPAMLTAVCDQVRSIHVRRHVDTGHRRRQLQLKTGAGLTEVEFLRLADEGKIGHVGLRESAQMLASALGSTAVETSQSITPIRSSEPRQGDGFIVAAGMVTGLHQTVVASMMGRPLVQLELLMALGIDEPRDEIEIDATPPLHVVINDGTSGDRATEAIVVNCAAGISSAPQGLITMLQWPVASLGTRIAG